MVINHERKVIYSVADDKRLAISGVDSRRRVYEVKCSNFKPKSMILSKEMAQLYVSMREAIIFIFDVAEIEPIVMHTIKVNYTICRMAIDFEAKFLMALDVKGTLY